VHNNSIKSIAVNYSSGKTKQVFPLWYSQLFIVYSFQ